MTRITTIGICIQRGPFSETSQVVHFLTPDLGRTAAIAKGAFRERNSFQGNLDLLDLSRITLTLRGAHSMALLRQRDLIHHFPNIRRSLTRFSCASLVAELLRKSMLEGEVMENLFSLVSSTLEALDGDAVEAEAVSFIFQGIFLRLLGFEPVLDRCVECQKKPTPGRLLTAYPGKGGVICRECSSNGEEGYQLSWNAASLLHRSIHGDPLSPALPKISPKASMEVWRFFRGFFHYFLEKKIHSYAFIRELNAIS